MHKREVHYKGTLAGFTCNEKVRSNKELKQHIQKWCKSSAPKQMVLNHNVNMHKEVEHMCHMCPKITKNQVSLSHHINTIYYIGLMRISVTPVGKSLKTGRL